MHPYPLIAAVLLAALLAACGRDEAGEARGKTTQGAAAERSPEARRGCDGLPQGAQLQAWLKNVPTQGEAGGLASGRFEWAAIVDREGRLCALEVATDDPAAAWNGSQAIAAAKAYTANAFSTDGVPMSTARLYTLAQPGHSLYGAGAGNPFDPACVVAPGDRKPIGRICGGTIVFGGGLPLYRDDRLVGGLGVSGDTACADHEIAKRIRAAAQLEPSQGSQVDDILYLGVDPPSIFAHPLCPNTWRNGTHVGEEPPARR